jgi:hypothetical protein
MGTSKPTTVRSRPAIDHITRILLTDGKTTSDLYWFGFNGKDLYHGTVGRTAHFSYRESGQYHWRHKNPGRPDVLGNYDPLARFRGARTLMQFLIGEYLISHEYIRKYRGKKVDAAFIIDVRDLPGDRRSFVEIGIVEPGRIELLPTYRKKDGFNEFNYSQIMVVTTGPVWVYACLAVDTDELLAM